MPGGVSRGLEDTWQRIVRHIRWIKGLTGQERSSQAMVDGTHGSAKNEG